MPKGARRPCNQPGCPALVSKGYCDKHREKKQRGSSTQRGYGYRWQQARLVYLKENPLCVQCKEDNQIVAAQVIDHIIPHKGNQELSWDEDNWQSLCKHHHDIKTATEDGGFGN